MPAGSNVHVVAIGDFGTGGKGQIKVVRAIAERNRIQPFQLGLTLGDNFYYCGVSSVHDKLWKKVWESFFAPLKIPFYATLGNHDYGEGAGPLCVGRRTDPDAEVEYTKRGGTWHMPARYYRFTAGPAEFFALDTQNWNGEQKKWLQQSLAWHSDGTVWRVVYGHHPLFTSGMHRKDPRVKELREDLLPLLVEGKVDVYLSGHDHDMEHLRAGGIEFFVAGGGGARTYDVSNRDPHSIFAAEQHGFLELEASPASLRVQLMDSTGKPLGEPFVKSR